MKMKSTAWFLGTVLLLTCCLHAENEVNWQVTSAGGTDGNSTNYQLLGTVGQTAVEPGVSESFRLRAGYWQEFDTRPDYVCGDADRNELVNISDVVYLIAYIFGGGPPPDPLVSGDVDCNEIVNISDAVYLIAYIFGGGPEPCADCPVRQLARG